MGVYRTEFLIIGILYLFVFISGLFSVSKSVDSSDYLIKVASHSNQVKRATFFQFLMGILYMVIIVLFYPILEEYNSSFAYGFFSFRILAVVCVIAGGGILLAILDTSRKLSVTSKSNIAFLTQRGHQLKYFRDLINHGGMIIFLCLGSILLYPVLIQLNLIPFWILVWGIVGAIIAIIASILVLSNRLKVISKIYIILNLPIVIQEIVFAVWLIKYGMINNVL